MTDYPFFSTDLEVRKIDGRRWVLLADVVFEIGPTARLSIPAGFYTDGASVPRLFWSFARPEGKYMRSAVLHDFMYYVGMYSRAVADRFFIVAMESEGVGWFRRNIMYRAVRLFAGGTWTKYRRHKP